ncbi:hypothetical protein [Mycobacteroides saopaulense]|uniref:Uncharacterized protein n=1 Tax=Mycobacteroides saopaulense TaxID=1578165 RepID=A0A1S1JKY0_9MYCO|nr:hypothetical protein [Mycobacteroides saopaulense]ALR12329.1 hypothetical protein MYCSP_13940 [Mycobacteroides saopaulense]OHT88073.1 hypothetical protein BKG68_08915 [Mycobacteroides saopaulense]OHU06414.1 hypothetical protein BKG73_23060 [Mycobacteroides saopaulense]ORB57885.1 hypothetical protein BST43_11460 [Mycobacteroides saopaulense]
MTDPGPVGGLPIRSEVVITEDVRERLISGGLRTLSWSKGAWFLVAIIVAYIGYAALIWGPIAACVVFVIFAAIVAWATWLVRSRTRANIHTIPIGTVQRCEFDASQFTYWTYRPTSNQLLGQSFLTPRSMIVRDYSELQSVVVNAQVVGIIAAGRGQLRELFPRELFTDEALVLISRYAKITGKWQPPQAPTS